MRVPMANDVTVIIAESDKISVVRAAPPIAGSVLYFSHSNLASALETIRTQSPKVVAVESQFAESGAGKAFVDRLRALTQDADIQFMTKTETSGTRGAESVNGGAP